MFGIESIIKLLKNIPRQASKELVVNVHDRYSNYPSNGLTPSKLARIFREADNGDVMEQMELFEEMEEKDPHLFSQLQTRKNAVAGLDYEVIPASDGELDKQVAEFVKDQIEEIDDFEEVLIDLLDAIGKGIAFVEIVWAFDNGKFVIKDLKQKHQKHFHWDDKDILKVRTDAYPQGIELPKNKFIIHKYKAKSGHPSRAGILRVVAWMYLFKNYDIKDWVSFCEVFGMPLRVGKYDPSASEEDKRALMNALISLGTDAAGVYPTNTDIEIKESNKQSSSEIYENLARFCDEQISKAVLGQTLTSDGGGGSYAQSKTHNEVRHDLTVSDCKALARTLRRDLIAPLVHVNFGVDVRIPHLRFDCEEAEDLEKTANMYDTLINKLGLPIATSHLYKIFSVPKPEDEEEVAEGEKQESVMVANKFKLDGKQENIDELVYVASKESGEAFKQSYRVLENKLGKINDLKELKELLENEEEVYKMLKDMQSNNLEKILGNSLVTAQLMGRVKKDG